MSAENTLWMGDIEPWMTEAFIINSFKYYNIYPTNVKLIKDKMKNINKTYCFVTFKNIQEAINAINNLNGKKLPSTEINFKLNWSDYQKLSNKGVYVSNLNSMVGDNELYNLFSQKYKSVHHAIVITDNGISKGYGFVFFKNEEDYLRCLKEMNGYNFYGNNIKVREQRKKDDDNNNKDNYKNRKKEKNKNYLYGHNKKNNNNLSLNNSISIDNNNSFMYKNNFNKNNNNIQNNNLKNNFLNNNFINNSKTQYNLLNNNNNDINILNNNQNNFTNFNSTGDINILNNNEDEINNNIHYLNNNGIIKFNQKSNEFFLNKKNSSIQFINQKNNSFIYENNINDNDKNLLNNSYIQNINNNALSKYENKNISTSNNEMKSNLNTNNNNKYIYNKNKNFKKNKNNQNNQNNNKKNNKNNIYKLEVLDNIDEKTLFRKIHESILRTFEYHKKLFINNGVKFKSKY